MWTKNIYIYILKCTIHRISKGIPTCNINMITKRSWILFLSAKNMKWFLIRKGILVRGQIQPSINNTSLQKHKTNKNKNIPTTARLNQAKASCVRVASSSCSWNTDVKGKLIPSDLLYLYASHLQSSRTHLPQYS